MDAPKKAGGGQRTPALARLLSESALYRAALGACGVPVAILDSGEPARPLVYVNAAFEALFGYTSTEALGRGLGELLLRGDDPLAHRLLAGQPRREIRAWTRDGTARLVEAAIGAVRDADGKARYWIVAFSDLSEVDRLREELAALKPRIAA